MKKTILSLSIILVLAGCHSEKSSTPNQEGLDILNGSVSQTNPKGKIVAQDGIISAKGIQWGVSNKLQVNSLSQQALSQGHYFLAMVSEVEGYRPYLYNDNKGYAIGMGWNVSMQTRRANSSIAESIALPNNQKTELVSLSNMAKPNHLPRDIQLSTQQAFQAVEWMKPQYEKSIEELIGPGFSQLAPNKQAVLIYHVYKVGAGGAAKYHHLIADVKAFIKNPNEQLNEKIAKDFTYHYTINGQVKQDTRAQLYMASMWLDPSSFNYIVNNEEPSKMPADMPFIAKTFEQKINIHQPIQEQISNPVQDALRKSYENGQLPSIELNETKEATSRRIPEVDII